MLIQSTGRKMVSVCVNTDNFEKYPFTILNYLRKYPNKIIIVKESKFMIGYDIFGNLKRCCISNFLYFFSSAQRCTRISCFKHCTFFLLDIYAKLKDYQIKNIFWWSLSRVIKVMKAVLYTDCIRIFSRILRHISIWAVIQPWGAVKIEKWWAVLGSYLFH